MFSKKASSPAQREVNSGSPDAAPNPTEAQKRVGNYRKVHLSLDGFRISIENPKGSVRSGTSPDGTKWSNTLACDYGDISGTEDKDGDPVDIYLSDHPEKGAVFVIDQIDPKTKEFDEHKVMYGFDSVEDAKKTYLACYQKGWGGLGWITPVSKAEFRKWIDSSDRKTKPFHEYKSVTPIVDPIKVAADKRISFPKENELTDSQKALLKVYDRIAAMRLNKLEKKAAAYSLKEDPTYEDVLKVFNKLDFDDRANLAPRHPDSFRKVPDNMLFDRQVAVDGDGNPVGFNEFYYGIDKLGRRRPPYNSIAVVPEARGNRLARLMVEAAVRKARKEKIRRLVWEAFADNKSSIHAALSAGFEDATPKNAKEYRRLVYRLSEEKQASAELVDRQAISAGLVKLAMAPGGDNKECVKEAQSVKWAQFVPINTLKWLQEKDKISPDADTRHFFDTIVPYIKSHSDTAGTPGVDYNASKFVPGFYRSVDIRKKKLPSNMMGASSQRRGVRIDHSAVGNSSTLVHELKHQQNQDGFADYSAWQNYIPFTKKRFIQSGRSAADDRLLSDAYHFTQGDVGPYYPFADEDRLKIILRAEQGTTHAEHQFAIMRELKEKLGRNPTGEEFVDYVRAADLDKLNSWRREFVPNGYQYRADARNPSPQYGQYRRTAEEEAEKLDFPRWVDFASKSEMDKHKQQPWYNPDIFRRSTDEGDPFDKTTESGIRGGFNPKYKWIDGRIEQMREQNTKSREPELESFRRALMNVAKNKVRPGGLYQNAQNTRRGMIV